MPTLNGHVHTLQKVFRMSVTNASGLPWWLSGKKSHPPVQETQVQSLVPKDPLEKEMATHSSILAWEIPWTEEPGGLQFMGSQELDMT